MKTKIVTLGLMGFLIGAFQMSALGGESAAGNGDGFTLVGDWPGKDVPVKFPEFSADQLEQMKNELLKQAPQTNLTYKDLFDPKDQEAFDYAQNQIYAIIGAISNNIYSMKQALVRAVLAINEAEKYGMRQYKERIQVYRDFLKEKMVSNIKLLLQSESRGYSTGSPMIEAAKYCKTETCVFEIQKVATEMQFLSYAWNNEVEFDKIDYDKIGLFWEPTHPMLKNAVGKYISDKLKNKDVNAIRYAVTSLTRLPFMMLVAPAEFLVELRVVSTSLNFYPGVYDRTDSEFGVRGYIKTMSEIHPEHADAWTVYALAFPFTVPYSIISGIGVGIYKAGEVLLTNPEAQLMSRLEENFQKIAGEKLRGTVN